MQQGESPMGNVAENMALHTALAPLLEVIPDPAFFLDATGEVRYANQAAYERWPGLGRPGADGAGADEAGALPLRMADPGQSPGSPGAPTCVRAALRGELCRSA